MCWLPKLRLAGRSNTLYRRMMKFATWIPGRKIVPNVLIKNSEVGLLLSVILHVPPFWPSDSQNQEEMGSARSVWTRGADVLLFILCFFGEGVAKRFMILCHDQHIVSCWTQLVCGVIIYEYYTAERLEMLSIPKNGHETRCLSGFM